jgi:hypothetical protein
VGDQEIVCSHHIVGRLREQQPHLAARVERAATPHRHHRNQHHHTHTNATNTNTTTHS